MIQLDMFAPAAAPVRPAPQVHGLPRVFAFARPQPHPLAHTAGPDPAAVLHQVRQVSELPEARITLARPGWEAAMAARAELTQQQMHGQLTPRAREVLSLLQRLELMRVGQQPDGAIVVLCADFEWFVDGRAGLAALITPEV